MAVGFPKTGFLKSVDNQIERASDTGQLGHGLAGGHRRISGQAAPAAPANDVEKRLGQGLEARPRSFAITAGAGRVLQATLGPVVASSSWHCGLGGLVRQ
jgi:hypothetical protein